MTDQYSSHAKSLVDPAELHWLIVPDDDNDLPIRPRSIYCHEGGTIVLVDETGTALSYDLTNLAGWDIPFRAVRVLATGTTGTYYGWV